MRRRTSVAALAAVAAVGLAACTGPEDDGDATPDGRERRITVWSGATEPRHLAGTKRILAAFTKETGIEVELVPADMGTVRDIAEGGRDTPSPGSTKKIPDVIGGLPVAAAHSLAARGVIDTGAVDSVLSELGRDTFQQANLGLAARGDEYVAVPSDAAIQLIVYRADLFAEAGLAVPDTFGKLEEAAAELDTKKRAGIVLPSAAGDVATARTFEHLALANGCHLLNDRDQVSVGTSNCIGAFTFYRKLASHGPPGRQSAADAREAYLAGDAAIIPASSAILDDLGGDGDNAATCPECEEDPAHLAKNSGIVAAIRGPDGTRPVQSGTVSAWTITNAADTEAAQRFVTYMMAEGYLEWLGVAPGATLPVRLGTAEDSRRYARAWAALPAGSGDNASSLSGLYSPAVLDLLRASPANFGGWGQRSAEAALVSAAMRAELPVPEVLSQVVDGRLEPAEAAREVRRAVTSLRNRQSPSPAATRP